MLISYSSAGNPEERERKIRTVYKLCTENEKTAKDLTLGNPKGGDVG